MGGFKLSRTALREVAEIVSYLHLKVAADVANSIESRLFKAFVDLAEGRAIGHARTDLARKNILFHTADPYVVVFRRTRATLYVLRVIHGKRDLKRLLN